MAYTMLPSTCPILEESLRFAGCHGYWPHNHFVHPRINFRLFPLTFRFLVRSARSIRLILDDESTGKRKPGRRWSIVSWNAEEERTLCWDERSALLVLGFFFFFLVRETLLRIKFLFQWWKYFSCCLRLSRRIVLLYGKMLKLDWLHRLFVIIWSLVLI